MSGQKEKRPRSTDDPSALRNRPDENTAGLGEQKRPGMMSKEQIEKLGAEKGFPEVAADRAQQSGKPGPEPEGDSHLRPSLEGGRRGKLLDKHAQERSKRESSEKPVPAEEWKKYDWE